MRQKLYESMLAIESLKHEVSTEKRQLTYSRLKASREQASFAIMMRMDPITLTEIRKEFFLKEDTVNMHEFVYILHKHLSWHGGISELESKEFAANMIDLFKDIDVNGDEGVSWIEFTTYIVEKAGNLKETHLAQPLSNFVPTTHQLHPASQMWRRYDYTQICPIGSTQFAAIEELRKSIFVFGARTGNLNRVIKTAAIPMALEYAREGSSDLLIASLSDMSIVVHNLDDFSKKRGAGNSSHTWATQDIQMSLAYAQASNVLYSGAHKSISSWSLDRHEEISSIPLAHDDIVMDMLVLKNIDTLVSCSLDTTIVNWDTTSNKPIHKYDGHRTGVFKLTYSPAHRLIVSVGFDHDACVWSPFVSGMVYRLKGHLHTLVGCHAVEDKPEIITADASGTFKLWDIRNFGCVQTWQVSESKATSKISCFAYQSWPSEDATSAPHCRIIAASKALFSFDQKRVKKESTSDKYITRAVYWNEGKTAIISVSERNVLVWDALIGSAIHINQDLCKDITASCLDDRSRKVFIGTAEGDIHCVNPSNGSVMKSVSRYNRIDSPVCTLIYISSKVQILAGFSNGCICLYDESSTEECRLVKMLEKSALNRIERADKLCCIAYDKHSEVILSASNQEPNLKVWSISSGKNISEIEVCEDPERVYKIVFMDPYPLLLTVDSGGNVFVHGSPGLKGLDGRVSGWINQTTVDATIESKRFQHEDKDDDIPNRVVPQSKPNRRASMRLVQRMSAVVDGTTSLVRDLLEYVPDLLLEGEDVVEDESIESSAKRAEGLAAALAQAVSDAVSAEMIWGLASVTCLCFNAEELCVYTSDEKGTVRKFCLQDMFDDIDHVALLENRKPTVTTKCRHMTRDQRSALIPVRKHPSTYLIGSKNCISYLGVKFVWAIAAHKVRITAITNTPRGILTAADDRVVKMWSTDGYLIGSLKQNVPVGMKSACWDLILDVSDFVKSDEENTNKILASVNCLEMPDITDEEYDFAGMHPSEKTVLFTQSELRKRIEKSSKKLVLDFGSSVTSDSEIGGLHSTSLESSVVSVATKSSAQALAELRSTDDSVQSLLLLTPDEQRRRVKTMILMGETYMERTGITLPQIDFRKKSNIEFIRDKSKSSPSIVSGTKVYEGNGASVMAKMMDLKSSRFSSFENLKAALEHNKK